MLPGQIAEAALPPGPPDQKRVPGINPYFLLQHLAHRFSESLSNTQLPLLQQVLEDPVLFLFQRSLNHLGRSILQMNSRKSFKRLLHEISPEMSFAHPSTACSERTAASPSS